MLTLRYQNAMADHVGRGGLTERELKAAIKAAKPALRSLLKGRGRPGFAALPYREGVLQQIESYARRVRGRFRNLVQIGIGGSSLGAAALTGALLDRFHNERGRPRLYFLDNVDPEETASLFDRIDPAETLFHVVTKSGETTETVAGFLVALERLHRKVKKPGAHLVVTTDRRKGFLRKFADAEGLTAFEIPANVGGRFSVLSPVGLLPAAVAGIRIEEVAAGAILADELCSRRELRENPAAIYAIIAHQMDARRNRPIHVMMPYARALRDAADWYRQLWAESLGKRRGEGHVGPTPVVALGATDQHSQIQLFVDGPEDKLVTFVTLCAYRKDVFIPVSVRDPAADFLHGKSFSDLIIAEQRGTEAALAAGGRPSMTVELTQVSPRTLGAFFFFFEMATVFAGRLYGVDPFDQPGVEAGKRAAFALLGREGHRDRAAEVLKLLETDAKYVIR
jgi:glucose-6-phosphate isomerase